MTEELYYKDPYQRRFDAQVIDKTRTQHGIGIMLDRTCFRPGGGGQPADTGTLNGARVTEVFRQQGQIVHVCEREVEGSVIGEIDWKKRFDHMQQHSGQHVLSQAFLQTSEVDTKSFHLGSRTSYIDLNVTDLDRSALARAEGLANRIIWENRRVDTYFIQSEEAGVLQLRGAPPQIDGVRVVEVEGFDLAACGGTHVRSTGEVGLIKIIGRERCRGQVRLVFLCGGRALNDYSEKDDMIAQLVSLLGTRQSRLALTATHLAKENEAKQKQIEKLEDQLLDLESSDLLDKGRLLHGARIVFRIFEQRPLEEVRRLVQKVTDHDSCIALVGIKGEKAHLIFARSKDLAFDMRHLLKDAVAILGGQGGGHLDFAEGGAPSTERLEDALDFALGELNSRTPDA